MTLWIVEKEPTELKGNFSEEDLNTVIRAAYKQVLGNAHLMESQRNYSAESQLRHGNINVKGFISAIAKSQLYRDLFFERVSQYRFIELNCKHLLGRAPKDQTEISYHVQVYQELGYDAEIDSYLQSEEYNQNFGENIVPYCRYPTIERFEECISSLGGTLISVDASQKVWIGKHRQVILYRAKASLNTLNHELKQYWFKYGGINSKFESIDSSQKKLSQLN